MLKKNTLIFVFLSFILVYFLFITKNYAGVLGHKQPENISDERVLGIEKLIIEAVHQNKDLHSQQLKNEIYKQVNNLYPIEKNATTKQADLNKIKIEAQEATEKKFSKSLDKIKNNLSLEADKKFLAEPLKSNVTVEYRQGPFIKKATGTYLGISHEGNGILVGQHLIPLFDLSINDKIRFIPEFRKITKENYVEEGLKKYQKEKELFTKEFILNKLREISKYNEDIGYIFAWQKWRTPEDITKIIIDYYIVEQKKAIARQETTTQESMSDSDTAATEETAQDLSDNPLYKIINRTKTVKETIRN